MTTPATAFARGAPARPSPWRRLAAYAIDSLFLALYLGFLFVVVRTVGRPLTDTAWTPGRAHLLGFLTLTLPVVAAFALAERLAGGTVGKRLLGLRVETRTGAPLPLGRSLLRAAVKFAPWELAHAAIHRVAGWPVDPEPLALWQVAAFYLSMSVAGQYVLSLFLGRGRPLYDRVSGAFVRAATPPGHAG